MKILIAADMEGISGVVNWDQVSPDHAEYARFRRIMTQEINAALRGAFEGGANQVTVSDGHNSGSNILIEELDSRARLNSGSPSPFSMVQGIEAGVEGVFLVGYHARAGSLHAVLSHTWTGGVTNLWLNQFLVGETGLNAALCGHFGAPVLMISGDQTACAQAQELLGPVETAVVKQATGQFSAECLPPGMVQELVCTTARRAARRLAEGAAPPPFRLQEPVTVKIEFTRPELADRAAVLPGVERLDGRTIQIAARDMPSAYSGFRAAVSLAGR